MVNEYNETLFLPNLVLEVTRRCTQQCAHCMCGPMQNINIDKKVIDAVFKQLEEYDIVYIEELFFTGGEPFLNIDAIEYIIYKIATSKSKIYIDHFGIKTNGMVYNDDVVRTLNNLYSISINKEECSLECSYDQFHVKPSKYNINQFKKLPFFVESEEVFLKKSEILNTGLAKKNKLGCPNTGNHLEASKEPIKFLVEFENETGKPTKMISMLDPIFINSKGYILTKVDGSYLFQDTFNHGNILLDSLLDISKQVRIKKIKAKRKNY